MSDNTKTAGSIKLRLRVALLSLAIACVFILALSFLLATPDSALGAVLLDRHTTSLPYPLTVQNVMWLLFFISLGELWVRFRISSKEHEQIHRRLLPEDDSAMLRAADLGPIYKQVRAEQEGQSFYLPRLITRCILQFQSSRSVDQANTLLNSSLELFQHELDLRYNMLRYLVWLIPTLGFIGTVIGIAFTLDFAAGVEDPQDPALLGNIAGMLGVAFYTTLLALLQSAVLMFGLHIAQAREEMSLNLSGQYCLDNLINRLYEK